MEPVGTRGAVPPVYHWLAAQSHTIILEYPMTHYQRGEVSVEMANIYQYYSVYHWHSMINGSTSIRPFANSALVHETEDCFPCPRSLDALWALGVKYVVVHLDNLSAPQRTDFVWRSTSPAGNVLGDFVLVQDFGELKVYELKGPRQIGQLKNLIAPGSSLLLADPQDDPIVARNERMFIGGGYLAAVAYYLREHPQYGDSRLSLGQPIHPADPQNRPDYALLWANQDPTRAGYLPGNRIWSNEFVALYARSPGMAARGTAP
jgi:hypothetical protein